MKYLAVYILLIVFVIAVAAGYIIYQQRQKEAQLQRQEMIHQIGSQVMPFSLDATTHTFKKTATGGIETVTAKSSSDTKQIQLIQMHLQRETEKFKKGDFSDPALLHSKNMPGLNALEHGASNISFSYTELRNGASITYTSSDSSLVDALHMWFDAQVSDHGHDAMGM